MTAKWLSDAAREYAMNLGITDDGAFGVAMNDFIAGAELMAEKAAEVVEAARDRYGTHEEGWPWTSLDIALERVRSLTTDGGSDD